MIRINDIVERVAEANPQADLDIIDRAYIYSARVHAGQLRLSGEPYLSHPLEVAYILAQMNLDPVSVAAGMLHDVVEDTHATAEEIEAMFGPEVRHIVVGVTKMSKVTVRDSRARQAESIRKMLLAMADDLRVILIKLADRVHNMRTLEYHRPSKRRTIAQETLDIYAPIAARLGIYWMKHELEDIAFLNTEPEAYENIRKLVADSRVQREEYVGQVMEIIRQRMAAAGIPCRVLGRYKKYFSIYSKMHAQSLAFEDVYDIIAFRIVLDTIPHCYEALGVIHALWKPIDVKFKDYIARPKSNMYQSLHTTVIGPKGVRVEIQIRTEEMDEVAKSGIAAHWSYKEGHSSDPKVSQQFAWIQNLIENQENIRDPKEFMENVRIDLFPDEVYVFTPNGDIRSLSRGATPVDFAYLIHTEVGHHLTGAKINGRLVPLQTELETGDVVEILTSPKGHPSKDWLAFVKTVKARAKIRQWVKTQEKERSLSLGREMCEKAFRKCRLNFNNLLKTPEMEKAVEEFGFKQTDDLIASVGYGKITPLQIVRRFLAKPELADPDESLIKKLIGTVRKRKTKSKTGVTVKGMDDILVRFGKCCQPVPGDAIVGYITRGAGVTIHRSDCVNALKLSTDRYIDVEWSVDVTENYPVKIRVNAMDRVGLLADVVSNITKNGANILTAWTETKDDHTVDGLFTIGVADTEHLNRILADIRKVKLVQGVRRVK
jgi:guanosine-3',5'-bis(diphosphate) 3'-pyrophosphohydrolase